MDKFLARCAARRFVVSTMRSKRAVCPETAVAAGEIARVVLGSSAHGRDVSPELYALHKLGQARRVADFAGENPRWFLTGKRDNLADQ